MAERVAMGGVDSAHHGSVFEGTPVGLGASSVAAGGPRISSKTGRKAAAQIAYAGFSTCKPSLGAIKKATRSDLNRMECLKFESRHSCLSGTHAGLREEIAVLRRMKLPKIPLPTKSVHKNHSSS